MSSFLEIYKILNIRMFILEDGVCSLGVVSYKGVDKNDGSYILFFLRYIKLVFFKFGNL